MKLDPSAQRPSTGKLCPKHPRFAANDCHHCRLDLAYEAAARDEVFLREMRELNPERTHLSESFLEALENWAEARDHYRAKLKACTGPSPDYFSQYERNRLDDATKQLDNELMLLVARIVTVMLKHQPSNS